MQYKNEGRRRHRYEPGNIGMTWNITPNQAREDYNLNWARTDTATEHSAPNTMDIYSPLSIEQESLLGQSNPVPCFSWRDSGRSLDRWPSRRPGLRGSWHRRSNSAAPRGAQEQLSCDSQSNLDVAKGSRSRIFGATALRPSNANAEYIKSRVTQIDLASVRAWSWLSLIRGEFARYRPISSSPVK